VKEPVRERAAAWIEQHLADFAIPAERTSFAESLGPLCELAMTAAIELRAGDRRLGERWLEHAWTALERGQVLARTIASSPAGTAYAYGCAAFAIGGLREPAVEAALLERSRDPRLPHAHRAAIAATLAAVGQPSPWPLERVIADDWARRLAVPTSLTADDLQTLAREAVLVTRFAGTREPVPEALREPVTRWLPLWLGELLRQRSLELAADMLVLWGCVSSAPAPGDPWTALAGAQLEDGSIPPAPSEPAAVAAPTAPRARFLRGHRATLVTIAAAALSPRS